jgi:hypothetical protein
MATATAPIRATTRASRTSAAKAATGAAVQFAVTFFLTVASVNVPHTKSDAKLLDWWQKGANLNAGIASELFAIAAAVLFVVVINYFRSLTTRAHAGHEQWTAFAYSMGTAFSCTLLVSSALRGVVGYRVKVLDEALPGVDVLRYTTALNYTLIGTATMAACALTIAAVSVVVLRTHVLGRWVGYVGVVCAAVIAVAVFAMYGAFAIPMALLWALCFAVAIWRQPVTPA